MVETIPFRDIPLFHQNSLFLDFIDGKDKALQFFQHQPMQFKDALEARKRVTYNRQRAADSLYQFNVSLNADQKALDNIEALRDSETFCVITGQQVGMLTGPVYTTYKILTTIQLSRQLSEQLNTRFIPVFWGASEDHDFHEINHVHYLKKDGEIGKLSFSWTNIGNSIYDLPIANEVRKTIESYFEKMSQDFPFSNELIELFQPHGENNFVQWTYSIITRLFSRYGVVIADPRNLRPYMGDFLQVLHDKSGPIEAELRLGAEELQTAGYVPTLDPSRVGKLFTYGDGGLRVRLDGNKGNILSIKDSPEKYSPDVALRPLFADIALPIGVNVLGPNEICYMAQLYRLYKLFDLPQPVVFPRKSCTILSENVLDRLLSYGLSVRELLTKYRTIREVYGNMIDQELLSRFNEVKDEVSTSFLPLKEYLIDIDPNLTKTWNRTIENILFRISKLEDRTTAALLSRSGYTKFEVQLLKNLILPKGRVQERIFPLSHFIGTFGDEFLEEILNSTSFNDFSHQVITI